MDSHWIQSAYKVLSAAQTAMHVKDIEERIRNANLVGNGPSMTLEVLLTKEAAMGRKFTKPDGSPPGYFSLLPPQQASSEGRESLSPPLLTGANDVSTSADTLALDVRYEQKYHQLKKTCKQMIYLNAALYDEISRLEKKIEKVSKERKVILRKVMSDLNISNHKSATQSSAHKNSESESMSEASVPPTPKHKSKVKADMQKKSASVSKKRKRSNEEEEDVTLTSREEKSTPMSKKSKHSGAILIPPIDVDQSGRPLFPLQLPAGLKIYSIGEICEKPGYCTSSCIYPVGYCCTRKYASVLDPNKICRYTCKVSEGESGPKFEISPDTGERTIFVEDTPEACHTKLLQAINEVTDKAVCLTADSDFFGLNHPVVRNLLQCSQGASSCVGYERLKYEVVSGEQRPSPVPSELDPASSFRSLAKLLRLDAADDMDSSHDISSDNDTDGSAD